jgi:hypothetical protein
MNVIIYLASILVPWILKILLYHYAFRWRHIHATLQTKIIVAGAPMLVTGLTPIPLPGFLIFLIAVGVSLYLSRKFTDGKLFPDLALIVVSIEIISMFVVDRLILPIFI